MLSPVPHTCDEHSPRFRSCNTFYHDRAYNDQTHAYKLSVLSALRGQDIPYTFFNGPNAQVKSDATAIVLHECIATFAETGVPSGLFPLYGINSEIRDVSSDQHHEGYGPHGECTLSAVAEEIDLLIHLVRKHL